MSGTQQNTTPSTSPSVQVPVLVSNRPMVPLVTKFSPLLGYRLERDDGVAGVIVNGTADAWRAGDAWIYDIVWADKSFARKVQTEAISLAGWTVLSERVNPVECSRMWSEYQVERARQMAQRHVGASPAVGRPIEVNRQKRLDQAQTTRHASVELPVIDIPKPASWHARRQLAHAMPDVPFSVSMNRRKLIIGWLDGPVEGRVLRALGVLKDNSLMDKVVVQRGLQPAFVQAAMEHVLARVWPDQEAPRARADRMRLTADDFLSGVMTSVMTPSSCLVGAVSYGTLIRCVVDRWDDELKAFVDTERTRYLVQERALLFPGGDVFASTEFATRLLDVTERVNEVREYANSLGRRERER